MKNKFQHVTDLASIRNINDVIAELVKHETVMAGTEIENLLYFSRTYIVTNCNIHNSLKDSLFDKPELFHALQMNFAKLYFRSLNRYAQTGQMSSEWSLARKNFGSPGLALFLGIYAHIKGDSLAALSMLDTSPDVVAVDFFRLNGVLLKSSREIVRSYDPDPRFNLIRELARKLLIRPISLIIFGWRRNAWLEYSELKNLSLGAGSPDCLITWHETCTANCAQA